MKITQVHSKKDSWLTPARPFEKVSIDPLAASRPRRFICEVCGAEMVEVHCKIECPNCGYRRDCSDP